MVHGPCLHKKQQHIFNKKKCIHVHIWVLVEELQIFLLLSCSGSARRAGTSWTTGSSWSTRKSLFVCLSVFQSIPLVCQQSHCPDSPHWPNISVSPCLRDFIFQVSLWFVCFLLCLLFHVFFFFFYQYPHSISCIDLHSITVTHTDFSHLFFLPTNNKPIACI